MAETTTASEAAPAAAPAITQGQTTAVGESVREVQEVPAGSAAEAAPESSFTDMFSNPLFWGLILMWLWLIFGNKKRKAQKAQERKERERRETLQKGDTVITIGRMHGSVVAFTETTVTIKPDAKADYTMLFDRNAIARVMPRPDEEAAAAQAAAEKQ